MNPVTEGGGIKTKMIESIALGTPVVAMKTAATGLSLELAGPQLTLVQDHDWAQFADAVATLRDRQRTEPLQTPDAFYAYYNWDKIIERLVEKIFD